MSAGRNTARRDRHRAAIRRTGAACWICGQPIDYTLRQDYTLPDEQRLWFVVDHKHPWSKGGDDTLANKAAAHWVCNSRKAARLDGGPVLRRSQSLR